MPDDDRKLKRQRGEFATYNRTSLYVIEGKCKRVETPIRVRVMSRAEGYAMVRLPRAMPFVVSESELSPEHGAAKKQEAAHG